jgi:hypothetical protein
VDEKHASGAAEIALVELQTQTFVIHLVTPLNIVLVNE